MIQCYMLNEWTDIYLQAVYFLSQEDRWGEAKPASLGWNIIIENLKQGKAKMKGLPKA